MKFCRIKLAETNYQEYPTVGRFTWISGLEPFDEIYKSYCRYKQFSSVMPLFLSQFQDPANDIHVYYNNEQIVAWSLCRRWDEHSAESLQFAWNYANPDLELGRLSLEHECAYYKRLGYKYLYLGESANYKAEFDGYELLGPI
jgi:arginyl-tRNA--protein-N-Asp/Glu arginylyltransferase